MTVLKSVLVIGASGFIGTKLISALSKEHCRVVAITHRSQGSRRFANVTWLRMDIATDHGFQDITFADFDLIIHMATVFPTDIRKRDSLFTVNTSSALRILDCLVDHKGTKKTCFLYLSAMSIFRGLQEPFITIDSQPIPHTEYDCSKYAAEICLQQCELSVILRIPLLLEAGASRSWLTDAYGKLLEHETLTIVNGAALYNHIIDFDSILQLVRMLLLRGPSFASSIKRPLNLGSQDPITINEIIHIMKLYTSSNSIILQDQNLDTGFHIPLISTVEARSLGILPKSTGQIVVDFVAASSIH